MVATIGGGSGTYNIKVVNGNIVADDVSNISSPYTYTYEDVDGTGTFVMNITDASDPSKTTTAQFAVTAAPIPRPAAGKLVITPSIGVLKPLASANTYSLTTIPLSLKTFTLTPSTNPSPVGVLDVGTSLQTDESIAKAVVDGDHWRVDIKSEGITKIILKAGTYPDTTIIVSIFDDKTLVTKDDSGVGLNKSVNKSTNIGKSVTWTTENLPDNVNIGWDINPKTGVATLTPSADGTSAVITATGNVGDEATVTTTFTWVVGSTFYRHVSTDTFKIMPILVTSVTMSPKTISVNRGDKVTVHADVLPADATNKDVVWSLTGSGTLKINADTGEIDTSKILSDVSATITATAKDGSGESDTGTISVKYV